MTRTGTRDFAVAYFRHLATGPCSAEVLSLGQQPLLPNVERILRNTGICTEPGDVQPARRLSLHKIAPESLPLFADFSRHGPLEDRARSERGQLNSRAKDVFSFTVTHICRLLVPRLGRTCVSANSRCHSHQVKNHMTFRSRSRHRDPPCEIARRCQSEERRCQNARHSLV